jgi:hypothetical protein
MSKHEIWCKIFRPLPLLQKGLYRRHRRLLTRSLRGVVGAPDCLNDDPVWWWNFTLDRLGWVSRLVPSDHDEVLEIDFASDFELTRG